MVNNFQALHCWQNSRRLTSLSFELFASAGQFSLDGTLKNQICRAALSVMNNIAEGFSRRSTKEAARFYEIAIGSCMEVESMTYVLEDLYPKLYSQVTELRQAAVHTKAQTINFRKHVLK